MKKYMKLVGNVVSALSILFVLSVFARTDFQFQAVLDWKKFLLACMCGIVIKVVTVFLSGSAWVTWLSFFASRRCNRKEALRVYAKANIGKYMPGNVMHYVERNLFAQKLGVSQKRVAASSVCEVATLVLTALLLGGAFAFPMVKNMVAGQAVFKKGMLICCIAIGSLFLIVAALVFFKQDMCRQMARKWKDKWLRFICQKNTSSGSEEGTGSGSEEGIGSRSEESIGRGNGGSWHKPFAQTLLCSMLLYAVVLAGLGIIFVLLYWYQEGQPSVGQAVHMVACYMVAWAVGFVVPGAPGGIGVRELMLIALLKSSIGRETVATLGVWHRLITVVGDLAAYMVALCFGKSEGD